MTYTAAQFVIMLKTLKIHRLSRLEHIVVVMVSRRFVLPVENNSVISRYSE
jgi:hypothetical protein